MVNNSRIFFDESHIHDFFADEVAYLEKNGFTVTDIMPNEMVDCERHRRHVRIYPLQKLPSYGADV